MGRERKTKCSRVTLPCYSSFFVSCLRLGAAREEAKIILKLIIDQQTNKQQKGKYCSVAFEIDIHVLKSFGFFCEYRNTLYFHCLRGSTISFWSFLFCFVLRYSQKLPKFNERRFGSWCKRHKRSQITLLSVMSRTLKTIYLI